jgi:FkbM family methyltransferase
MLSTHSKIKIARILSAAIVIGRRVFGRPSEVTVMRRGVRWRLNLKEGIDLAIYLLGRFEVRTIERYRKLLREGDVALDIGANIGAHTLPLAQIVGKRGKVYSFEPTAYAYGRQKINISLNPELEPRISAHHMMLMDSGAASLPAFVYSSWPLEGADDLNREHFGRLMQTEGAAHGTLDQFIRELGIEQVDFIKLDVDGNELSVLKGSKLTINRFRPLIMLELAPYVHSDSSHSFEDLISELTNADYAFFEASTGRALPQNSNDLIKCIPAAGGLNVLAVCDRPGGSA